MIGVAWPGGIVFRVRPSPIKSSPTRDLPAVRVPSSYLVQTALGRKQLATDSLKVRVLVKAPLGDCVVMATFLQPEKAGVFPRPTFFKR